MITIKHKGSFTHTENFFDRVKSKIYLNGLHEIGHEGVAALAAATPVDTGKTAASWTYKVTESDGEVSITWNNTNTADGIPIVILLQYGHATGNGGYVKGVDFINPALKPLFDKLTEKAWKEVTKK